MSPSVGLLLAALLIFLNGFFVAAEFALVKVRATRLKELAAGGSRAAAIGLHSVKHLDTYLSATQVGITLASIALGWVGEPSIAHLLKPLFDAQGISDNAGTVISGGTAFALIVALHIVLGELVPKTFAIARPERVTLGVAFPLQAFFLLFRPVVLILDWLAGGLVRMMGVRHMPEGGEEAHSEAELRMLVSASGQSGVLNEIEVEIAGRVLGFGDKTVSDVMIPRMDLILLDAQRPFEENVQTAISHPYSRYPLVDGDVDIPLGAVHVKDLFRLAQSGRKDINEIRRDAMFVPTSKPLDQMLRDFQREKMHMALVLDEYGGTLGVVTLEDVIEQIVGEIADEHDVLSDDLLPAGEGEWTARGRVRLATLAEKIGLQIDSEEYDSIGGFLTGQLDRAPRAGDVIEAQGARFEIERVHRRGIRTVRIRYTPPSADPSN